MCKTRNFVFPPNCPWSAFEPLGKHSNQFQTKPLTASASVLSSYCSLYIGCISSRNRVSEPFSVPWGEKTGGFRLVFWPNQSTREPSRSSFWRFGGDVCSQSLASRPVFCQKPNTHVPTFRYRRDGHLLFSGFRSSPCSLSKTLHATRVTIGVGHCSFRASLAYNLSFWLVWHENLIKFKTHPFRSTFKHH